MNTARQNNQIVAKPDLVIIGAMRAGTTTVDRFLRDVPGVSVSAIKETNFFCSDVRNSDQWAWYERQFDASQPIWVDVSPRYAKRDLDAGVAKRIAAINPNAKIVFIARDPVERAISQYNHSFHMGQAMPLPADLKGTPQGAHIVSTSRYFFNLEPYLEVFGDRITILDFQGLQNNPDAFFKEILDVIEYQGEISRSTSETLNTSDDLSRQPKWWGQLRESQLGEMLRKHVPRSQVLGFKRLLLQSFGQEKPRVVPAFTDQDRAWLIEELADDIAQFRSVFKKDFRHWQL